MNILVVADWFPWPPAEGSQLRQARTIEALARLGEVDLFSLCDSTAVDLEPPPGVRLARLGLSPYPAMSPVRQWLPRWALRRGVPLHVAIRAGDPGPRRDFADFARDAYDVVWFGRLVAWSWLGQPRLGPTIIDIDDLEDVKARQHADLARASAGPAAERARAYARYRVDAADWARLQRDAVASADRVVVCSEEDALRLGGSRVAVVPNTCADPPVPVGRARAGRPPVVLLPASFDYWPNVDAARWLVEEIAPRLRRLVPDAIVRLAGRPGPEVDALAGRDGVEVVGAVPDMTDELARADVVVVPVRYGSGTRLKIIEAMAQRVPVVSTPLGAEGLDVADGVHLLLGRSADELAEACRRAIEDDRLRSWLAESAQTRFRVRYENGVAAGAIRELVDAVARRAPRPR